jgi:hypothetical protein
MNQTVSKIRQTKAGWQAPRREGGGGGPDAPAGRDPRRARDVADVEELLLRHALGSYAGDGALVRSCFAEPAPGGAAPSEAAALARAGLGPLEAGQHYYSIVSVRVRAGAAEAIVHHRAGRGRGLDAAPFDPMIEFAYRCRRSPAGWRIVNIAAQRLPDAVEWGPGADVGLDELDLLKLL